MLQTVPLQKSRVVVIAAGEAEADAADAADEGAVIDVVAKLRLLRLASAPTVIQLSAPVD